MASRDDAAEPLRPNMTPMIDVVFQLIVFFLVSMRFRSLDDFVGYVFSSLGLSSKDHVQRSPALLRPAEIPSMRADPSRAAERLGWRATVRVAEVARRLVAAELEAQGTRG